MDNRGIKVLKGATFFKCAVYDSRPFCCDKPMHFHQDSYSSFFFWRKLKMYWHCLECGKKIKYR